MQNYLSIDTTQMLIMSKKWVAYKKKSKFLNVKINKLLYFGIYTKKEKKNYFFLRCFIIFPLFILASAKKQLWLPELSCTDYVPDLSDPPGDLFGMELSCIDNNSTLKLPTLLSPFSGTFTLQSPVSESERESLYSGMNSQRAECENLKTERQKLDFLSPHSMKVIKANPESCLMLTGLKLRTLVVMIDYLS